METNTIIAIGGLFNAIYFTSLNIFKAMAKQNIPAYNFVVMAAGWTAFISIMWLVP